MKLLHNLISFNQTLEQNNVNFRAKSYKGIKEPCEAVCLVCGGEFSVHSADYLRRKRGCELCTEKSRADLEAKKKLAEERGKALPKVAKHNKDTYQERLDAISLLSVTIKEFTKPKGRGLIRFNCCGGEKEFKFLSNVEKLSRCPVCNPYRSPYTRNALEVILKERGAKHLGIGENPKYRDKISIQFSCGCVKDTTVGTVVEDVGMYCQDHNKRSTSAISEGEANKRLRGAPFGRFRIVGNYTGVTNPCDIECINCGHVTHNRSPQDTIIRRGGCYVCGKGRSFKEGLLRAILFDLGYTFESEATFSWLVSENGRNLFCDVYIKSLNLVIEYDGGFQGKTGRSVELDNLKDKLLAENGVRLVRIGDEESITEKIMEILEMCCATTSETTLKAEGSNVGGKLLASETQGDSLSL